ncbi:MAG: hypothetical protein ACSHX6_00605 [Akkermansiaceae bacterium]
MKILFSVFTLFLVVTSISLAEESVVKIAKVDYSEVSDLLEEIVLARPENKELGERFLAQKKKSDELQEMMQQAILKGEKINPMEAASGMMDSRNSGDRKKIEMLCEKLVLEVIEKAFEDKYQIILKSGYRSSLLYTKVAIDDVTDLLRQELLGQLPEKR